MPNVVLVVAGGERPSSNVLAAIPPADVIICADSGVEHALEQHWKVDICIGDFDSATGEAQEQAEAAGAEMRRYPADKDQTDLELALTVACEMLPSIIYVIGIGGGRVDHALGNLLLLANPAFAQVEIRALVDTALVTIVHESSPIKGELDELVSVFAVNSDAQGVNIHGMQYRLVDATLPAGSSLGLSNRLTGSSAVVSVDIGTLVVIQPHRLSNSPVSDADE